MVLKFKERFNIYIVTVQRYSQNKEEDKVALINVELTN